MSKMPWEDRPDIWPSPSRFYSWVRGGIRLGLWNKHPLKLEHLKLHRFKIDNGHNKDGTQKNQVWGGRCSLCGGVFKQSELEVDHKDGNHSLKSLSDIHLFIENIVLVKDDDLQLVCKPCHKVKNYAEKHGMSHKDAAIEKEAIALCKLPVQEQTKWIVARGETPASNAKQRREQIRRLLSEEVQNN